jgi:hypothetical protein
MSENITVRLLPNLLLGILLIPLTATSQERFFLANEGSKPPNLVITCEHPQDQRLTTKQIMAAEKEAIEFAKKHGFIVGSCSYNNTGQINEWPNLIRYKFAVLYITAEEIEAYKNKAKEMDMEVDLTISKTWPPEK